MLDCCQEPLLKSAVLLQVIDDSVGNTLAAASTLTPEVRSQLSGPFGSNQVSQDLHRGGICGHPAYAYVTCAMPLMACSKSATVFAPQDAAQLVGKRIAELCLSKKIEKVCFDRGGHIYHGRIKVGL